MGHLICVLGSVVRTGPVMLRESKRVYMCERCESDFQVEGDLMERGAFELPRRCPASGIGGDEGGEGEEEEEGVRGGCLVWWRRRERRWSVGSIRR